MKVVLLLLCAIVASLACNEIVNWNNLLLDSIAAESTPPPMAARYLAMVHTAQFDAVNSIMGNYQAYAGVARSATSDADADAAAAKAAHDVLLSLYPSRASIFDTALTSSLASLPAGPHRNLGVTVGSQSASTILQLRAADGSAQASTYAYSPSTAIGAWRPTAPANAPFLLPGWGDVRPFGMYRGNQHRPVAPPVPGDSMYHTEYNEVKQLGRATGSTRTPTQTNIAHLWAAGSGTVTPPGMWFQIAQQLVVARQLDTESTSRLFALLGIGAADAAIAAWDSKREFSSWRPITAIQLGDSDGDANTMGDAAWTPLLPTPPFPSYISGHSTFSSTGATILARFFGSDAQNFDATDGTITRSFTSLWTAAEEAGMSRIYGGIHFQADNIFALQLGTALGNEVYDQFLLHVGEVRPDYSWASARGRTGNMMMTQFAAGHELYIWEPSMRNGIAWANIEWDRVNNKVSFEYNMFGLPYAPSFCYDYNPTTFFNQYPDCMEDGVWQGWIVAGMHTITWYYTAAGDLIGNEYDLNGLTSMAQLPAGYRTYQITAFHMICTKPFESDPSTLVARPRFVFDMDKTFLDDAGLRGVLVGAAPTNLDEQLAYCQGGAYPFVNLFYTQPERLLKPLPEMKWENIVQMVEGGGAIMLASSYEPRVKTDYPYLTSRDNLMIGWGTTGPSRGQLGLPLTELSLGRPPTETAQFRPGTIVAPTIQPFSWCALNP